MMRECRRCRLAYRPEKVAAEDDHGRLVCFVTSPLPWCNRCIGEIERGQPLSGRGTVTEDLSTK